MGGVPRVSATPHCTAHYNKDMHEPRTLPLFDPQATPQSWNERMAPGEYAVLFANTRPQSISPSAGPVCVVFDSLASAEEYAHAQVALQPRLRCNIYDHHGLANAPLEVIAGTQGADNSGISSTFRRWVGGALFIIGAVLGIAEWHSDFRLTWAGTLGSRIGPIGAILLITEAGVMITARQKRKRAATLEK